jgi:hypothetical protein
MHIIRLRGPWQLEPVHRWVRRADGGYDRVRTDLPAAAKATMPADWSGSFGGDFLGCVKYSRHFNLPTGLAAGDKVFLVVEPPRSWAEVCLGGETLGRMISRDAAARYDVTDRLEAHNRLEILVDHPAVPDGRDTITGSTDLPPGGLVGEVRLEIEEHR